MRRLSALLMMLCLLPLAGLGQPAAPEQAIAYAILSHERIAQDQFADFLVDYLVQSRQDISIALYDEEGDTPLRHWRLTTRQGAPRVFRWDGRLSGQPAALGHYRLSFAVGQEEPLWRGFEITAPQPQPALAITPQDDYLPSGHDDASVWGAMMAPAVVVDIGATAHQPIYDKPGRGRRKLGEVHGQTAALKLLALDVEGHALVGAYGAEDGSYIEGYVPQNKLKVMQPDSRYGLLIDKNAQTMSVYQAGQKISTLAVSTGLIAKNKLFRETKAGAFLTLDRMLSFDSEGYRYDYAIRIDGGNLIHQAGYRRIAGQPSFDEQLATLHQKASHGCVRVDPNENAEGLNALWLWHHLPRATKVLVLDDPAARQLQLAALYPTPTPSPVPTLPPPTAQPEPQAAEQSVEPAIQGLGQGNSGQAVRDLQDRLRQLQYFDRSSTGYYASQTAAAVADFQLAAGLPTTGEADGATLTLLFDQAAPAKPSPTPVHSPAPTAIPPERASIRLSFMGDCIIGSEDKDRDKDNSFDSLIAREGLAWPFAGVQHLLKDDDLSIINFEGVLKDDAKNRQQRLHNFRGPLAFAGILPAGSIEVAGLANNHFDDYGRPGRLSTQQALDEAGVMSFGYGKLLTWDHEGIRLGFGGIRETTYKQGRAALAKEIQQLKAMGAHYIIYTCHFGNEYEATHNALQTQMAYAAIDAGADLVIGAHSHVVQGVERYKDGLILYSLGNFVFGGNLELTEFGGLLAQLQLDFRHQRLQSAQLDLIPVLTTGTRPANNFQPIPATGEDKARIMDLIQADSGELAIKERMIFTREDAQP